MTRRLRWRALARPAAVSAAVVLVLTLARDPAAGAFSAQTGDTGNSVGTASSFCVASGPQDVPVVNDAWTDQSAPTTAHGNGAALEVASAAGANRRTFLRFTLPAVPSHCELVAAQLRVRASTPSAGRTIDVLRADPAQSPLWTANGLTWANQPAAVGTAAGSSSLTAAGIQTWDVTVQTTLLYGGPNNGFVLKDRTEDETGPFVQEYDEQATPGGTPAVLRLTWG